MTDLAACCHKDSHNVSVLEAAEGGEHGDKSEQGAAARSVVEPFVSANVGGIRWAIPSTRAVRAPEPHGVCSGVSTAEEKQGHGDTNRAAVKDPLESFSTISDLDARSSGEKVVMQRLSQGNVDTPVPCQPQQGTDDVRVKEAAATGEVHSARMTNGSSLSPGAFNKEQEMRTTPAHILLGLPADSSHAVRLEALRSSNFSKYCSFARRWLERKREKAPLQKHDHQHANAQQKGVGQQQKKQRHQHQHFGLRQGIGQGEGVLRSHQHQGARSEQPVHQQVAYRRHLQRQPQGHMQPHYPANQVQTNHSHPGGLTPAQHQAQLFALSSGLQYHPPQGAVNERPPRASAAPSADEAIDLTDDTPAPTQPVAPQVQTHANIQVDQDRMGAWHAYQAYTQQHQKQHAMQMVQSGTTSSVKAQGALDVSPPRTSLQIPYPPRPPHLQPQHQSLGNGRPLGYGEGPGGAKRARYERWNDADEEQGGTVTFSLISTSYFTVKIKKPTPEVVYGYFKLIPGATFDTKERRWKFPLGEHEKLAGAISRQGVKVVPVPRQAIAAATLAVEPDSSVGGTGSEESGKSKASRVSLCEKMVPACVRKILAPFQMEGVEFVLKREGRALIADEMGLGKTIQAIACAAAYESEWPLLIICPSSARYHWEHELLKWLDEESITKKQITVVCTSRHELDRAVTKVVIMSYELVNRMKDELDAFNFGVVVCDECHYLKNQRAARTKAIFPLATKARRAILLSGTPALSRPSELFTQLNLISSKTWASFKDFGKRYCSGRKGKSKKGKVGWDYSGASHIPELHALLRATVMVRRLKKDILKQLPPKERSLVEVQVEDDGARGALQADLRLLAQGDALLGRLAKENADRPNGLKTSFSQQVAKTLQEGAGRNAQGSTAWGQVSAIGEPPKAKKVAPGKGKVTKLSAPPPEPITMDQALGSPASTKSVNGGVTGGASAVTGSAADAGGGTGEITKRELVQQRRSLLMKLFADTGTAKIPAVLRHVSSILADEMTGGKVLVFAHHRNVLDALEMGVLKRCGVEFIRIDGRTKPKDRQDLVDTFQTNASVRVALLGLTAAGIGITLTAASRVVFAELYWTPAQLLQAEDRCHRIGQASVVKVQYLVAKGSLDDALWPLIQQKLQDVTSSKLFAPLAAEQMKLLGEMVEGQGVSNSMEVETTNPKKDEKSVAPGSSAGADTKASLAAESASAAERNSNHAIIEEHDDEGSAAEASVWKELQESVLENAQVLAVEDMRHELDDEGRREFEEELGDGDGDIGSRGDDGSDSSGYSDGGGGRGMGESVFDIADSDDEESDGVSCSSSKKATDAAGVPPFGVEAPPQNSIQRMDVPSADEAWTSDAPVELAAAIAAAEATAQAPVTLRSVGETRNGLVSSSSPADEVIDLLSGDEADVDVFSGQTGASVHEQSYRNVGSTNCNGHVEFHQDHMVEVDDYADEVRSPASVERSSPPRAPQSPNGRPPSAVVQRKDGGGPCQSMADAGGAFRVAMPHARAEEQAQQGVGVTEAGTPYESKSDAVECNTRPCVDSEKVVKRLGQAFDVAFVGSNDKTSGGVVDNQSEESHT